MNTNWIVGLLFLGWLIGWTLKYLVFGLDTWDAMFHPERRAADDSGPYKMFSKPFLGVLS